MPDRAQSMRRDIFWAYVASASRIGSWVVVSALVYRRSALAFAMLALVRGTLGILNYCSLGLLPAMIRAFATTPRTTEAEADGTRAVPATAAVTTAPGPIQLDYVDPQTTRDELDRKRGTPSRHRPAQRVYGAGVTVALISVCVGGAALAVATRFAGWLYRIPAGVVAEDVPLLVGLLGGGFILRWISDPDGAALQYHGWIWLDHLLAALAEWVWVIIVFFVLRVHAFRWAREFTLSSVGGAFAVASALLAYARSASMRRHVGFPGALGFNATMLASLLGTGLLITLAQLADYLYAPTDYILINRLLTARDLADYAPALQIDGGLMILVGGLAAVLLPKAAVAHGAGDRAAVRAYYVRGTLASAGLLAASSVLVYLLSPWIFRLWLGDPMPRTRAILPLVLIHTTLGGSALVGRSILLGVGRVKPFTISVLIAGVTNVVASYAFVRYLGWGLKGIVLGTIVAVVARCGLWMPWYVMRHVGDRSEGPPAALAEST